MGWTVPPRGQVIRVICCELARISAHLLGMGALAMDTGAMTVFLYIFTEREKIYNLIELLTGARFTTSYTRVGGLIRDLPPGFVDQTKAFVEQFKGKIDELDHLLTRNKIFVDRNKGIGIISKEDAIDFGMTGPICAAAAWIMTSARPGLTSPTANTISIVPTGSVGDCFDRYLCAGWRNCARARAFWSRRWRTFLVAQSTSGDGKGFLPAQGQGADEDGGADPPVHPRHRGHPGAGRRGLLRRGKSEGRIGLLYPKQGRRRAHTA